MSPQIGPAELDLMACVRDLRDPTVADCGEHLGRVDRQCSAALRRLHGKGMLSRSRVPISGRPGRTPYRYRLTIAGRARLRRELARGREPGVSSAAVGLHQWAKA